MFKELKRLESGQSNFKPFKCSDENCKERFKRRSSAIAHYKTFHENVITSKKKRLHVFN